MRIPTNRSSIKCCWKKFGFLTNPNNGNEKVISINTSNNVIDGIFGNNIFEDIQRIRDRNKKLGRKKKSFLPKLTITDPILFAKICSNQNIGIGFLKNNFLKTNAINFKSGDLKKFTVELERLRGEI